MERRGAFLAVTVHPRITLHGLPVLGDWIGFKLVAFASRVGFGRAEPGPEQLPWIRADIGSVSRHHGSIEVIDGEFEVTDNGSSGGMYVDDIVVARSSRFGSGSAVHLGNPSNRRVAMMLLRIPHGVALTARCPACHGPLEVAHAKDHDIAADQLLCNGCGGMFEAADFSPQ